MRRSLIALTLAFAGIAGAAHAATPLFTPEQLDRMAKARQNALPARNWGPPVTPPKAAPLRPLPAGVSLRCMSTVHDFPPVYAAPDATSRRIGVAAPTVAATDVTRDGWTKILRAGETFAWVRSADLTAFQPFNPEHPTRCAVAGERANGLVVFSYPS